MTIEELKRKVEDSATYAEIIQHITAKYRITYCCDANDGDYIDGEIWLSKDEYENDVLFQLALAYIDKYGYSVYRDWEDDELDDESEDIYEYFDSWFYSYVKSRDLLLFAGMVDSYCQSIEGIFIRYYLHGKPYGVTYDLDKIFDSKEDIIKTMTWLYENTKENG